ncbi:MAG TPA: class I SAM-dependent methyltransferase [Candidatus Paceibacterota bacterium]|nr:class I SAM-dependent methyltransferase [Candidatus Paceibacterota bacterium]
MVEDWKKYIEKTKNRGPRSLLVEALGFVPEKEAALDLGPGALNDSKYLLEQGFKHITAVDKNNIAGEIADALPKDRFNYVISSFKDFDFTENTFDLVNAQFALPFIEPSEFQRVFASIKNSLKPKGVFTGQLFGINDDWNKNESMNFHTREQVERLFADMKVIKLVEEEKEDQPVVGDLKHWHIFNFISSKP